jgi:nicotinamide riboside transporter PnuC
MRWPKDRVEMLEWIGSSVTLLGALIMSIKIGLEPFGYVFFLIGSLIFCYVFHRVGMRSVLILNIVFSVINIIGVWRWLIVPWLL